MENASLRPAPGQTLVGAVMARIADRIAARSLGPGARLPSIRALAQSLAVSKSTVVEAYDRLAAEGVIASRAGSGFYVAARPSPFRLIETEQRVDRAIDPLWVMRQSLDAEASALTPGCGWLPRDWMPEAAMARALRGVARDGGDALSQYDQPLGHAPLREHLSRRLGGLGVEAEPNQILLTDSCTQALDLICRFLLEPGDAVLLDDPCYFNFQSALRAHRLNVIGVPFTPYGPDLDAFAIAAAAHRPRLYVTNAALHNPTGASLSAATAQRLLKIVDAHDMIVVEDDIFMDFEPEPAPRLAALDGLKRVIHIGGFAKTLSASARCGHIAARGDWIEGLADLKLATSFGSSRLTADLIHRLLIDGGYRRHMDGVRRKLAVAMRATATRLDDLGLSEWGAPRGGMFHWRRLPDGLDSADVAKQALARGVVLAPGDVFSPSRSAGAFLRFNAAQCASPAIFDAVRDAMREARLADAA